MGLSGSPVSYYGATPLLHGNMQIKSGRNYVITADFLHAICDGISGSHLHSGGDSSCADLERTFGVTIADEQTGSRVLRSVSSIARFIEQGGATDPSIRPTPDPT